MKYRRVLHRPDRESVEPIVVVGWIDSRRIEVQIVAVRLRVERRAPVVPVRASVVEPRTVAVARGGEDTHVVNLCSPERYTLSAVLIQYPSDGRCGSDIEEICGCRLSPDTMLAVEY